MNNHLLHSTKNLTPDTTSHVKGLQNPPHDFAGYRAEIVLHRNEHVIAARRQDWEKAAHHLNELRKYLDFAAQVEFSAPRRKGWTR